MKKFTDEEDRKLVAYLATKDSNGINRMRQELFKQLVDEGAWARTHPWSSWRQHYKQYREKMDQRIKKYQDKHGIRPGPNSMPPSTSTVSRRMYGPEDDKNLIRFLARKAPLKIPGKMQSKFGRSGNYVYRVILSHPTKYLWAAEHTWHGWRERYAKHHEYFDQEIAKYQEKHGIDPKAQLKALQNASKQKRRPDTPETEGETDQDEETDDEPVLRGTKRNRIQFDEETEQESAEVEIQPPKKRKHTNRAPSDNPPKVDTQDGTSRQVRSPSRASRDDEGGDPIEELEIEQSIVHDDPQPSLRERTPLVKEASLPIPSPPPASLPRPGPSSSAEAHPPPASSHPSPFEMDGTYEEGLQDDVTQGHENMTPIPEDVLDKAPQTRSAIATRSRLKSSGSSPEQARPIHRTLPTPSSGTPRARPRGAPASTSRSAVMDKTLRNVPVSTVRSHPPTPPPTNVQSDASVPPASEPDPPVISDVAKGKQRAERSSPSTPPSRPNAQYRSNQSTPTPKPPRTAPSPPTIRKIGSAIESFGQTFDTILAGSRKRPFRSPSESSLSDGSFVTSTSTVRKPEVIRGLPKAREGGFRNMDRVRSRRVVPGQRKLLHTNTRKESERGHNPSSDANGLDSMVAISSSLVKENHKLTTRDELHVSKQPAPQPSTYKPSPPRMAKTATSTKVAHPAPSRAQVQETLGPPAPMAPTTMPRFTAISKTSNHAMRNPNPSRPVKQVADVFASTVTPIPSGSSHDPYVLRTSHLPPEPSTAGSAFSRVRPSTPVPPGRMQRDRNRRRTFAGFGLRNGLPDINLLAELKAKRTTSRSPALVWTRGSPDITILSEPETHLLSNAEHAVARRGPSRKSVIPVVVQEEEKAASAMSISLDQLSPTTSEMIVREGLASIFKRMERNHGFSSEVVRRTWLQKNMDIHATDKKLLRMRIAAEMAANSDEDDDRAQHSSSKTGKTVALAQGVEDHARLVQPSGPATDIFSPADYTPPFRSRAGHYRRFLEQGRHGEAKQREIELASRLSTNNSPSTVTPAEPAEPPVWGKKEDEALEEALRTSSEDALKLLAKKFGDKVLRQKSLALLD